MSTSSDQPEIPDALLQDAQAWVRKLNSGEATEWDAQAFRRWRDASPLHQAAFLAARAQWRLLQPALDNLVKTHTDVADYHRETLRRPARLSRRAFLGAAMGTVAAAGVAAVTVYSPLGLWPAAGDWNADYRTATGEQRVLTLTDQVNVTLNTRTSIRRVSSDGKTIGLDLLDGEAAIEVPAMARGFSVVAGTARCMVESARFEVRYVEARVRVICLDGQVRITHPTGVRLLQANQQIVYSERAISGIAAIDSDAVSAWRHGELVFKQTPLSAVIAEINRYRPGRVVLMNTSAGNKTVSARFRLARLDLALLQIQRSFDLTVRSLPAGVLVLS